MWQRRVLVGTVLAVSAAVWLALSPRAGGATPVPRVLFTYTLAFERECGRWFAKPVAPEVAAEAERLMPQIQQTWDDSAPQLLAAVVRVARKPFKQRELYGALTACDLPIGGMSHPLIFNIRPFLTTVMSPPVPLWRVPAGVLHELLHWYADDYVDRNTSPTYQKYRDEPDIVKNHLYVMSVMQAVYVDVIHKPEPLAAHRKREETSPAYKRAWEIVDAEGANVFIDEIRHSARR